MKVYSPPLTVWDLEAMPEDGNRYELIEGELYVSAAPSYDGEPARFVLGEEAESTVLSGLRAPVAQVFEPGD